jgi:hypothetical protein
MDFYCLSKQKENVLILLYTKQKRLNNCNASRSEHLEGYDNFCNRRTLPFMLNETIVSHLKIAKYALINFCFVLI